LATPRRPRPAPLLFPYTTLFRSARGVRDVIVVDKSFVASGATGKSSACVRQHYSTPETCRMIHFSLDRFQRFEELTGGHSCGFRSEEHTSELQSRSELVCRLLLE